MKKQIVLIVFLFLPIVSPAQTEGKLAALLQAQSRSDNEPSLDATFQRIKNIVSFGGTAGWSMTFTSGLSQTFDERSEFSTESGCNVAFVENRTLDMVNRDGKQVGGGLLKVVTVANLRELDPSSVRVALEKSPIPDTNGWTTRPSGVQIEAATTNLFNTMSATRIVEGGSTMTSQESSMFLYLSSEELGQRLAKALSHAITLCGGRSSAF